MKVIPIEEGAYEIMKRRFELFVREMEKLCMENQKSGIKGNWLDNRAVCQLLHISKRTLQYYRNSGKLPFSVIGSKCYHKASDVEKLIAESQTKK